MYCVLNARIDLVIANEKKMHARIIVFQPVSGCVPSQLSQTKQLYIFRPALGYR